MAISKQGTPHYSQMLKSSLLWLVIFLMGQLSAQTPPPEPLHPLPGEAQLNWHKLEQYAFIHFTINTFTDKEWGYGDESPALFNPTEADPEQWASVIAAAGLKGLILTVKHHDGFCLWPSAYTEHSVRNSPWMNGKGDLVRLVAEACQRHGLKFGIYLSPWDRNHSAYGTSDYIDYYRNQVQELATSYGPVFEWWLDGANGGDGFYGGAKEVRHIDRQTYYQWPETIRQIKMLQPNVLIFSDAGPDIRWVGNEAGYAGETNWNCLTADTLYPGKAGISPLLETGTPDGRSWIPAEVDVSIRPGWFWHASEDNLVKSPHKLFEIYLNSVGRGANLLLNIPPDKRGLIHENDVKALLGWKKLVDEAFSINLASAAKVSSAHHRGNDPFFSASTLIDNNFDTYWATDDGQTQGSILLEFDTPKTIRYVVLHEMIRLGQRVEAFSIDYASPAGWLPLTEGTTIGHKRILHFDAVNTTALQIRINAAKACPALSEIEIY